MINSYIRILLRIVKIVIPVIATLSTIITHWSTLFNLAQELPQGAVMKGTSFLVLFFWASRPRKIW